MSINSKVKAQLDSKIIHFNLNLDYLPLNGNIEFQTNQLINNQINYILNTYKEDFNNKIFILEYNDDLISVIAYNILNRLTDISRLNFYMFGKAKRTKKYIFKQDKKKFLSLRKIRKIKDQCVFISVFNPIYNVIPQKKDFNNLGISMGMPIFYLMKSFTPMELFQAQQFYGIGYINDGLYYKNISLNGFNNWIDRPGKFLPPPTMKVEDKIKNVYFVYLDENLNNNIEILQEIEEVEDIVMYFIKEPSSTLTKMLEPYSKWVKMKSNIPYEEYLNINNYELGTVLRRKYNPIFIGNWTTGLKEFLE